MRADLTDPTAPPPAPAADRPAQLPLERRLAVVVLVLFAMVLGTSLAVSYYEVRRAAELSAADRLVGLADVLGSTSGQQLMARRATLRRVAAMPVVVAAVEAPTRPLSDSVVAALARLATAPADTMAHPELLTIDGRAIGPMKLELPMDARRLREIVIAGPDSVYVGPLRKTDRGVSYVMAAPVINAAHRVIGLLVQERPVGGSTQASAISGVIGRDVHVYVHNLDGSVWTSLLGSQAGNATGRRRFVDRVNIVTRQSQGQVLSSTAPLVGTPMALTIERPMADILARPLASFKVLAVLAIVLAAVGATLAWLLTHRLVKPLGELTSAAEEMARGKYQRRVRPRRNDELGRLAGAFNRMAEQVEVSSRESASAVARLTASVETQKFLAEASRIAAGTISDERLLANLSRHCVPRIADYCTIHVAEDDGTLRRIGTVHRDPARQETVNALVARYPMRTDGPGEVAEVIRSQRPLIVDRLELSRLQREADTDTARLLEAIGPTSFMCVPLAARGRAFGAMSFTMTDSGRRFAPDDLEIAMELASRTSGAIDNALIYRRSIALRLEAEAASAAKSDFLARMSHEIRTPINAMVGYAELLQMGIAGSVTHEQTVQLARIRSSGEHLTNLVNEILDLAKIEAGGMSISPTIALAGDAADAALALIRPQATNKNIELDGNPTGEPHLRYLGDPKRVQQILTNLLANAVKFTQPGGTVRVCCSGAPSGHAGGDARGRDVGAHPGEWTCISVQDTGEGIAEQDLERIFHPFVQLDGGYTRSHGGTGLGLAISRSLAQMMGGDLSVESVVGQGSRFTLWLPSPDSCIDPE